MTVEEFYKTQWTHPENMDVYYKAAQRFSYNDMIKFANDYYEQELSKLRQGAVSVSDCIANDEAEHFMTIDCIGYCEKCGSMKQYER